MAKSAQYAHNNLYHSSIDMSPFQALFSRTNTPPFIRKYIPKQEVSQEAHELIKNFKISIDEAQAFAHEALKQAKFLQKDWYEKAHNFEI